MGDGEDREKRDRQPGSTNASKYPHPFPCLHYKGEGVGCQTCVIFKTGRCQQFRRTLGWIYKRFQEKYIDLSPAEKGEIFNDMFIRVIERISKEEKNKIKYFPALVKLIYRGAVADYFKVFCQRGLKGFGPRRPEDCGVSIVPIELLKNVKEDESDRSNFYIEDQKRHKKEMGRRETLENIDAAIAFQKRWRQEATNLVYVYFFA